MLLLAVEINEGNVTPVTQAITLALVGGLITILTIWLNNRNNATAEKRTIEQTNLAEQQRRQEKEDDRQAAIDKEHRDYARQDQVAERLERNSRLTMRKLTNVEELGKVTHALVNSDRTAQMKHQRDAQLVTLALMKEVVSLKQDSGHEPTDESITAIETLKTQIATLNSDIADRLAQQLAAEQRIELDKEQAGASVEAADRQIEAALAQQAAADRQIEAAEGMASLVEQSGDQTDPNQ